MSTLTEQVDAFLKKQRARNLTEHTLFHYEDALTRLFEPWCLAEGRINDSREMTLAKWNDYSQFLSSRDRARVLSNASVAHYLRPVLKFLLAERVNTDGFRLPAQEDRHLQQLTEPEYQRLITAATNKRDELLIMVLWKTGLRISEVLGLRSCW